MVLCNIIRGMITVTELAFWYTHQNHELGFGLFAPDDIPERKRKQYIAQVKRAGHDYLMIETIKIGHYDSQDTIRYNYGVNGDYNFMDYHVREKSNYHGKILMRGETSYPKAGLPPCLTLLYDPDTGVFSEIGDYDRNSQIYKNEAIYLSRQIEAESLFIAQDVLGGSYIREMTSKELESRIDASYHVIWRSPGLRARIHRPHDMDDYDDELALLMNAYDCWIQCETIRDGIAIANMKNKNR